MISIGLSVSSSLKQVVAQRLSVSLRNEVSLRLVIARRELIESLRGKEERFSPHAVCPNCSHVLSQVEILKGFLDEARDTSTGCPKCTTRFQPMMEARGAYSQTVLPFYCSMQVLDRLMEIGPKSPEAILKEEPAVYYSAIVHHGSLAAAFEEIGTEYPHDDEIVERDKRVAPFLGILSDRMIAEVARMKVSAVRTLRRGLGIPPYRRNAILED